MTDRQKVDISKTGRHYAVKTMKKAILILLFLILFTGCTLYPGEKPIGGEKDEHGCLPAAGYQWCPSQQKCMRMWEEYCEEYADQYKVEINSFEDCVKAGYPVMESYPRQCRAGDKTFVEEVELAPVEEGMSPEECTDAGGRVLNIVGGAACEENEVSIGQVVGFISPNICCMPFPESKKLTIEEAMEIAQDSECTQKGALTSNYTYNENSKTWWIDLDMKQEFEKEYCNPACVVEEYTQKVEINWRCTGAIPG